MLPGKIGPLSRPTWPVICVQPIWGKFPRADLGVANSPPKPVSARTPPILRGSHACLIFACWPIYSPIFLGKYGSIFRPISPSPISAETTSRVVFAKPAAIFRLYLAKFSPNLGRCCFGRRCPRQFRAIFVGDSMPSFSPPISTGAKFHQLSKNPRE